MAISTIPITADAMRDCHNIVVFTGAGMSAESGIPTFRDDDGFWQRFPVADFATWGGITRSCVRQPDRVIEFAHEVIAPIAEAQPNSGHKAIELMEHHRNVTVITQNIDGLHQAAGNTTVHEVHGSLYEVVSMKGRFRHLVDRAGMKNIADKINAAKRGPFALARLARFAIAIRSWLGMGLRGINRPKLVLFGDQLAQPDWQLACKAVRECDCLIQVGCSGMVYPAAELPEIARQQGAVTIAVDPKPTLADHWLQGTAAEILPELVSEIEYV